MSTTPLPPLPTPWIHDLSADEGSQQHFAADQMQTYAQQARADLEAENERLREALEKYIVWCDAESDGKVDFWERVQMCRDSEAAARAALKGTP